MLWTCNLHQMKPKAWRLQGTRDNPFSFGAMGCWSCVISYVSDAVANFVLLVWATIVCSNFQIRSCVPWMKTNETYCFTIDFRRFTCAVGGCAKWWCLSEDIRRAGTAKNKHWTCTTGLAILSGFLILHMWAIRFGATGLSIQPCFMESLRTNRTCHALW